MLSCINGILSIAIGVLNFYFIYTTFDKSHPDDEYLILYLWFLPVCSLLLSVCFCQIPKIMKKDLYFLLLFATCGLVLGGLCILLTPFSYNQMVLASLISIAYNVLIVCLLILFLSTMQDPDDYLLEVSTSSFESDREDSLASDNHDNHDNHSLHFVVED